MYITREVELISQIKRSVMIMNWKADTSMLLLRLEKLTKICII